MRVAPLLGAVGNEGHTSKRRRLSGVLRTYNLYLLIYHSLWGEMPSSKLLTHLSFLNSRSGSSREAPRPPSGTQGFAITLCGLDTRKSEVEALRTLPEEPGKAQGGISQSTSGPICVIISWELVRNADPRPCSRNTWDPGVGILNEILLLNAQIHLGVTSIYFKESQFYVKEIHLYNKISR